MVTLNERQRHYLLAAYALDQETEHDRKRLFARGQLDAARVPASVWRWMPYGRWQHLPGRPATPLRQALDAALVSAGTGSTWKALASRGLVEVEDRVIELPGSPDLYPLPHVRMTPAGRKLARQLTGEARPIVKPALVLSEATWRALVTLWQLDQRQKQWVGFNTATARAVGISWEVWDRLERQRPKMVLGRVNHERLVDTSYYRLTAVGRIYYLERWTANQQAYPHLAAPDPNPTPELAQQVRQLAAEADTQLTTPPAGVYAEWQANLQVPYYPAKLSQQQRQQELTRGIPTTPAALYDRPHLLASWRYYLQGHWLRQHLTPAEWNCCQLWMDVKRENGQLAWRTAASAVQVRYEPATELVHLLLGEAPKASDISAGLSQLRDQAVEHGCRRLLLNLRTFSQPLSEFTQRSLLAAFRYVGEQLSATSALRVALVGVQPTLTEWPNPEPVAPGFEWAAFTGELDARKWLAQVGPAA
ncbi:hypothetical protein [Hymenobacter pini]|uniref:hypothetical protein n=1 Tax=Hymenobacter pini TaxID=2880879 RepID=UPI001CF17AC9|nr:hypothetical protein [Hymenobacter pini]MCA8833306.1 hypothetical protein [Hymenobacter pini]